MDGNARCIPFLKAYIDTVFSQKYLYVYDGRLDAENLGAELELLECFVAPNLNELTPEYLIDAWTSD